MIGPEAGALLMLYALAHPMAGDEVHHLVPGARDFGRVSVVRPMVERYAPSLGHPWSNFPLVGDERGDRAEIERIMVGSFPLNIGNPTIVTREFPVGDPWLAMSINLRGQLNSVAAASGTVVADAPTPLWRLALTTDLDKDIIEGGVSVRALYRFAQLMYGTAGELVAPVVTSSTVTDFNVVLTIPFCDWHLLVPEDSILDTRRYNTITLTITTGLITDIVTTPVNTTLQTCVADIEVMRLSPRVPLPLDVVKVLQYFKQFAPLTPAADTFQNLDRVPTLAMKRLGWFMSSGSTAGVAFTGTGSNAVLDTVRVSSNRRDHFGNSVSGISRRVLQNANKLDYSIETWPTGWYWGDFVLDHSLLSALATGDLSTLQQFFAYQGGLPGTPQLSTLLNGVQKLRGQRGR
jgi:hypothetical protein